MALDFTSNTPDEVVATLIAMIADFGKNGDRAVLLTACEQGRFAIWRFEDEKVDAATIAVVRQKISEVAKLALKPAESWGLFLENDHENPYDKMTYPTRAQAEQAMKDLVASGEDMSEYHVCKPRSDDH